MKYIVVASTVRSANDGDIHFVSAKRLIELYGVDPKNCIVAVDSFRSVSRALERFPDAEILRPSSDGQYGEDVARKPIVKDRAALANLMTKLEGGKSSMKVGDSREFLKKLVHLEKAGYMTGKLSIFAMLRREAVALAMKTKVKKK